MNLCGSEKSLTSGQKEKSLDGQRHLAVNILRQHWATPPCSRCAGIGAHVGAGIAAHDHRNPHGTTKVSISIYNESLERLEKMVEMGFKEGTMSQLNNLDDLLAKLSREKESE